MRGLVPPWWHEDDDPLYTERQDPPGLEVEDEPNPVVARLVRPDGSPLVDVHLRPVVALGFHAGPRTASRIIRWGTDP